MTGPLVCTPDDFVTAADGFRRVHDEAEAVVTALARVLKGAGGCAGTDNAGRDWSAKYDPAAFNAVDAASALVIGAGQICDLLKATAANHDAADGSSTIGNPDLELAVTPDSIPIFRVPSFPEAYGGFSDAPFWWGTISAYVQGEVWPNGHQDQLQEVSDAWRYAAGGLRSAASHIGPAIGLIEAQQSPEVPQAVEQCRLIETQLHEVADQFEVLSGTCIGYSRSIDEAHSEILNELGKFALETAAIEVVIGIASIATAGAAAGPGQSAVAARLTAVGGRVAEIIRQFTRAAEASGVPALAAAGTLGRTLDDLTPLLSSRAIFYSAETVGGVPNIVGIDIAARRPYIRSGTRRAVEDATDVTEDGKYYLSATDDTVLIPVNGKYDPEITRLPMDSKGWYYVDEETGLRYPVNPRYNLGHMPGHEWWRIQEMARSEGWTRRELNDYANDPSLYRLEDGPGNWGHQYELPREGQ